MQDRSITQDLFYEWNSAAGLADLDDVTIVYGDWHLDQILAYREPCGDDCVAFLGCGHIDCVAS
jgi:hypothetical protein